MASILVCDDQRSICEMLDISLRKDGHRVETVNAGEAAKKKLSSAHYEVLITDINSSEKAGVVCGGGPARAPPPRAGPPRHLYYCGGRLRSSSASREGRR